MWLLRYLLFTRHSPGFSIPKYLTGVLSNTKRQHRKQTALFIGVIIGPLANVGCHSILLYGRVRSLGVVASRGMKKVKPFSQVIMEIGLAKDQRFGIFEASSYME